jgi:hypothetical protein
MPKPDLLNPPFLPPAYEEVLEHSRQVRQAWDDPSHHNLSPSFRLAGQVGRVLSLAHEQASFIRTEAADLPGEITSSSDLGERLQFQAARAVLQDQCFTESSHALAVLTGATRPADSATIERGYELGEGLVLFRAQHTASTILRAMGALFTHYPEAGQTSSVWQRTLNTNVRDPVIHDRAWEEFVRLYQQAGEATASPQQLVKPSRFSAVTFLRAAKMIRETKAPGPEKKSISEGGYLEKVGAVIDRQTAALPTPLEINQNTILRSMSTATKVVRRVRNAGAVDPTIAADPTARYAAYMLSQLSGAYSINAEKGAFDRKVKATAKQMHSPKDAKTKPELVPRENSPTEVTPPSSS